MQLDKIPQTPHFAIITEKSHSVYHEGDQRSRDCPGHGYPAHYETFYTMDYEATTSEDVWKKRVAKLLEDNVKFRAFKVQPVSVTTNINMEIQ